MRGMWGFEARTSMLGSKSSDELNQRREIHRMFQRILRFDCADQKGWEIEIRKVEIAKQVGEVPARLGMRNRGSTETFELGP